MSKFHSQKYPRLVLSFIILLLLSIFAGGCGDESGNKVSTKQDGLDYLKVVNDLALSDRQIGQKMQSISNDLRSKKISDAEGKSMLGNCEKETIDNIAQIKQLAIPKSFNKDQQEAAQNLVKTYTAMNNALVACIKEIYGSSSMSNSTATVSQQMEKYVLAMKEASATFGEGLNTYQKCFDFTQQDFTDNGIGSN
jgi:hypothetical protein